MNTRIYTLHPEPNKSLSLFIDGKPSVCVRSQLWAIPSKLTGGESLVIQPPCNDFCPFFLKGTIDKPDDKGKVIEKDAKAVQLCCANKNITLFIDN